MWLLDTLPKALHFFLNLCFPVILWGLRPSLLSSHYTDEAEGLGRLSDFPPVLWRAGGGGWTPASSLWLCRVTSCTPVCSQAASRSRGPRERPWQLSAWSVIATTWEEQYFAFNAHSGPRKLMWSLSPVPSTKHPLLKSQLSEMI